MIRYTLFTPRVCAITAGLFGTAVAILVYALFSVFLILGPVTSRTDSPLSFAIELVLIVLATAGSCLVLVSAPLGASFLVAAELGSFYVLGWLALLTAPLWLLAALLPLLDRGQSEQPYSWLAELESWRYPTTV